jgi:HEAT repeat protein
MPRRSFTAFLFALLLTTGCERSAPGPGARDSVTLATNGPSLTTALRCRDPEIRDAAAQLIVQNAIAVDPRELIRALDDSNPAVRRHCAKALGNMRTHEAVKPLFLLLQDHDWFVRAEAAMALGHIGDPRAVGWLLQMLNDGDAYVRLCAGTALRDVTAESHRPVLLQAFGRAKSVAKPNIAIALAKLREPVTLDLLISVSQTNDVTLRRRATEALGDYPPAVVTNTLTLLLVDADQGVRQEAARALHRTSSGL